MQAGSLFHTASRKLVWGRRHELRALMQHGTQSYFIMTWMFALSEKVVVLRSLAVHFVPCSALIVGKSCKGVVCWSVACWEYNRVGCVRAWIKSTFPSKGSNFKKRFLYNRWAAAFYGCSLRKDRSCLWTHAFMSVLCLKRWYHVIGGDACGAWACSGRMELRACVRELRYRN